MTNIQPIKSQRIRSVKKFPSILGRAYHNLSNRSMQLPASRPSRRPSKSLLCFFEVNGHKVSGFHGKLGFNCIHDRSVRIDNPIQLRLRSSAL